MSTKEPSSNGDPNKASQTEPEPDRKRRKHGYRGYPNNPSIGGNIHSGTGFGGVGALGGSGLVSSDSGILTEHTREDIEKEEEDEK